MLILNIDSYKPTKSIFDILLISRYFRIFIRNCEAISANVSLHNSSLSDVVSICI